MVNGYHSNNSTITASAAAAAVAAAVAAEQQQQQQHVVTGQDGRQYQLFYNSEGVVQVFYMFTANVINVRLSYSFSCEFQLRKCFAKTKFFSATSKAIGH